jgi:glycerol kinase
MATSSTFVLALDQGTSSSRAVLFDQFQHPLGMEQVEYTQHYPHPGWVEHDPEEIWSSQLQSVQKLLRKLKVKPNSIAAIGIANQRETTVVWDRASGKPIHNAIVWQDRRTADMCERLRGDGLTDYIKRRTGLVIDSYFSATKLAWILSSVPGAMKLANQGRLAFGTVDTWLLWKLTGGRIHATDVSNASRTMLFDITGLQWDSELLQKLCIPPGIMPAVLPSSGLFGETAPGVLGSQPILIAGIAGDQQAALFGQRCFDPGDAKNTYGTGCFMLMNTGSKPVTSPSGLLTTIAWQVNGETTYALEGSVFIAGAAIKWLRDGLKIIEKAADTEAIANSVPDCQGIYVVPAFTGLGAPYWDMYARGAIMGITQGVTDRHVVRATLESLAYQTRDIIGLMAKDSGIPLKSLRVDGGASANGFLMQFQADILNAEVIHPPFAEATALGAALLAGMATGIYSAKDIKKGVPGSQVYKPRMTDSERNKLYNGWLKAVERAKAWAKDE